MGLLNLRNLYKTKEMINETKQKPTDLENIFTNPISDRGLISKIYKELKKFDIKRKNNPIKNGTQT